MSHYLEDVEFSADSLHIIDISYFALFEDFNGDLISNYYVKISHFTSMSTYLLLRLQMDPFLHFAKCTLTKGFCYTI